MHESFLSKTLGRLPSSSCESLSFFVIIRLSPQRSGFLDTRSELRFSNFTVPFTGSFGSLSDLRLELRLRLICLLFGRYFRFLLFAWPCCGFSFLGPFLLFLLLLLLIPRYLQIHLQSCIFMAVGLFFEPSFLLHLSAYLFLLCLFVLFRHFTGTWRVLTFWHSMTFRHIPFGVHCCALSPFWQNCNCMD